MALSEFFIISGTVAILFTALYRLHLGYIGIASLIIVTVTAASSFGPLVALSALTNDLMHTFAAAERIFALFDEEPLVIERPGATAGKLHDEIDIQYDNILFHYPKTDEAVCSDLNIGITPNSKTAIVGQSGSGKSTILRLLLRFWDIDRGTISLNGEDIRELPLAQVRSKISMVSQETYLFNDTIEANIKTGNPDATTEEVETASKRANIHNFILTLPNGYQTKVGESGGKLSAGERQRIAIARALIHDAPIILLDEPTSNLDTLNEGSILKTLAKEFKDKTIITVSHRPSTIVGSEKILVLDEGKIVEQGTFEHLMKQKGTFWQLLHHIKNPATL
jgi:ATP-binding cassette subfamily C protein